VTRGYDEPGDGDQPFMIEYAEVKHETPKAILCLINDKQHWVPKRMRQQGTEIEKTGDKGPLVIPRWLAKKLELTE
jgi:hypothetical protein